MRKYATIFPQPPIKAAEITDICIILVERGTRALQFRSLSRRAVRRINISAFILCILICLSAVFCACSKDDRGGGDTAVPSAKKLLYGILNGDSRLTEPSLVYAYGEEGYADRFEALYHMDMSEIEDGAVALASGMGADEITVIRPKAEADADKFVEALNTHVTEQISVYEKYSPEDTANLENARVYRSGRFVILIVSPLRDELEKIADNYIEHPDLLPALPDETVGETSAEPSPTETDAPTESVTEPPSDETTDSPTETVPPETTADTDVPPTPVTGQVYRYENELPEREPVGDEFFEDAVMIGDSRIDDLVFYLKPKLAASYTYTSLSVTAVFTKNLVETENGAVTIAEALRSVSFKKCYLMFGLNELGWPYPQVFIDDYAKVINMVREINPECDIYVMNIYPVTKDYDSEHPELGNEVIAGRNEMIAEMCREQNVKLINSAAALTGEDGALPDGTASDGVHGNKQTCRKLFDYMHTHY